MQCQEEQYREEKTIYPHLCQSMIASGCLVQKPGEWYSIYNNETEENFVYYWDEDRNVGQKCCLGNCLKKTPRQNRDRRNAEQLHMTYNIYKVIFNLCDRYNRSLNDKKLPLK
jgi:hypothetical protein